VPGPRAGWLTSAAGTLLVLLLARPSPASADIGVGVGANPITLAIQALPGHRYDLPPLYVVNTGNERSLLEVNVQPPHVAGDQPVPPSWVAFGRNSFSLEAKASATIPLSLSVPADASGGPYRADLVVHVGQPNAAGAALGVGAIANLSFSVDGPAATATPQPVPAPTAVPGPPPALPDAPRWPYIAAAGALLLVVLTVIAGRKLPLRLIVTRRKPKS